MLKLSAMKQSSKYPIPEPIQSKLSELRGMISRLIACQGIVVLATWLLLSFWLFGILDYLPARFGADESPKFVRILMLAIMVAGGVAILYHFFWNRWLVRWSDSALALAIERQHPEFQSTLITTVQAAASAPKVKQAGAKHAPDRRGQVSDTDSLHETDHPSRAGLLEIARERAIQRIRDIDIKSLIRFRTLQWELTLFAVAAAFSSVVLLLAPGWTSQWGKRLFALSDTPWPRTTQLGLTGLELEVPPFTGNPKRDRYLIPFRDNSIRVPKGVSARMKAWAKQLLPPPYDVCTLQYRDVDGNRGRASMLSDSDSDPRDFVLDGPPLQNISDSLWMTLAGGDARISNLRLEAVDAPLALSTEIDVEYPSYLQRSTKTSWGNERIPYRNGMRLPQGSKLSFFVRTNKPAQRCECLILKTGETSAEGTNELTIPIEPPSNEFSIPLGPLDANILAEIRVWDHEGLCATRIQQFVVASINDTVPSVDLILEGIGTAITENAVLPVRSKIKDDYDVDQVWIETVVDEQPLVKSPIALSSQGTADRDIDLKAQREAGLDTPKAGSVLAMMVAASDFLDVNTTPHVGRSTPIQLSVVTPDQLLIILERRELAMRARLEQILAELGQLRDLLVMTNKNLATDPKESTSNENVSNAGVDKSEPPSQTEESAPGEQSSEQRRARLLVLRAQQAAAQASKSEGELKGVGIEIAQIVAELINNRVDSKDRRERLEQKIKLPLANLMQSQWTPFAAEINALESSVAKETPSETSKKLEQTILKNNEIIAALTTILNDMIDIQDFNEVIDMVRDLLNNQDKVLEKTKQEQKKRVLDLLK